MRYRRWTGALVVVAGLGLAWTSPAAQGRAVRNIPLEDVRRSQQALVMQRVANTDFTISYSRPVARGREIFGALVPWDRVWHPGADQATAITITRDVTIEHQPLAAGKYSLWTMPTATSWTIIFSRASDVFHTPYPGDAHDVLRLTVTPETTPHTEVLTWDFPLVEGKSTTLRLRWGTTSVAMGIEVP